MFFLSTLHATKHEYRVLIPEFSLSFLISFLGLNGAEFMKFFFTFPDSLEETGLSMKRILAENKEKIAKAKEARRGLSSSPERVNSTPEPTWFTPPRSNKSWSVISRHRVYESGIESDDDADDADDDDDEDGNDDV